MGHADQAEAAWEVPFMVTMTKGQDGKSRPGLGERRHKPEESNIPTEKREPLEPYGEGDTTKSELKEMCLVSVALGGTGFLEWELLPLV